jgi:hypothetical protein
MNLAKFTAILDLLAGMSAAPEIIGKERLKSFEERTDQIIRRGTILTADSFRKWDTSGDDRGTKLFVACWLLSSFVVGIVVTYYSLRWGFYDWDPPGWRHVVRVPMLLGIHWFFAGTLIATTYSVIGARVTHLLGVLSSLLYAVASRTELSRSLLLFGFFLFFVSGALKIAFL